MWNTVLKALPNWRSSGNVIRVVHPPVGAGENLLRIIRVNNDGIHRNIRQVPRLVRPGERRTVGSARNSENMAWR